jgi:hypothetical protein
VTTNPLKEHPMDQPVTWTARTVAEAQDLLDAVKDRIESGMKAAHPGVGPVRRMEPARNTPISLSVTFNTSELDRIANERNVFDAQVHDTP